MSASTAPQIQEGDKVSWKWGSGNPGGEAAEVKAGDVTVTSHRGNDITKHGTEDNPAVHIARPGNDVVKKASELTVESETKSNGNSEEKKEDVPQDKVEEPKDNGTKEDPKPEETAKEQEEEKKETETNGKATTGEKRSADKEAEDVPDAKKQKSNGTAEGEKKKPGRPKGNGPKKDKKEKKAPAQGTRRSTRNAGVEKNYGEE